MLQASGFHPGPDRLFGAIIGTSTVAVSGREHEPVFVWHDLSTPTRPTFSRSRGKAMRSVLERYDHEHDFRVKVAAPATRITGAADDPEPLVVPIGQKECGLCPYELWCADQRGPEDPSAAITRGRLDIREWQTLRRMGIATTGALADLEPGDPAFFDDYHPEVTQFGREQALMRLQAAVRQARMICDGQDDATARYQPVASFQPLDDEGEIALAERAAAVIARLRVEAESSGRTVAVYHWAHPEVSRTRKFGCVAPALDGRTVDLRTWFTGTFHVRGKLPSRPSLSSSDSPGRWTIPAVGCRWPRSRSPAAPVRRRSGLSSGVWTTTSPTSPHDLAAHPGVCSTGATLPVSEWSR